jgi:hypothetical protein
MLHEELFAPRTAAEVLLLDPSVQEGMRSVFREFENLYHGITEQTPYDRQAIGPALVTPSGVYIEASKISLPPLNFNTFRTTDEYLRSDKKRRNSEEYLIFAVQMQELCSPDFQLKPIVIRGKDVTGDDSYVDITLVSPDDPKPIRDTWTSVASGGGWDAYDIYQRNFKLWTDRNSLRIVIGNASDKQHSYRGEKAEPLKAVCERLSIVL